MVVLRTLCNRSDIWRVVYVPSIAESKEPFLLTHTTLAESHKPSRRSHHSRESLKRLSLKLQIACFFFLFFFSNLQMKDTRQK